MKHYGRRKSQNCERPNPYDLGSQGGAGKPRERQQTPTGKVRRGRN